MAEIVAFGEVAAEFMAKTRNQQLGAPGLFAGPFPGGAPAIFIDQAAKLGAHAAFVSAVGVDAFGDMLVSRLARDGVDVSAVEALSEKPTATAFVTYYDDGARDFLFNFANAACACIRDEQFDAVLADCKLLHVAGSTLFCDTMIDLARRQVARVRQAGGLVSFDPNVRKEMLGQPGIREALTDLLAYTDILLPSDDELAVLAGGDSEQASVARVFDMGVREVVVKCGAGGCRYHTPTGSHQVPGFAATEVDPTGAGDSFGATFCTLRSQGLEAEDALVYANAAGALAVSRRGAMEGTSSREELDNFMRECRVIA